jgi:hypothetical protein
LDNLFGIAAKVSQVRQLKDAPMPRRILRKRMRTKSATEKPRARAADGRFWFGGSKPGRMAGFRRTHGIAAWLSLTGCLNGSPVQLIVLRPRKAGWSAIRPLVRTAANGGYRGSGFSRQWRG